MWTNNNRYLITGNPNTEELDLFHLVVAPTFACNLRCKHCYLPDHAPRTMEWSMLSRLLDEWADIVYRERGEWGGVFHLKGGEPATMPCFEKVLLRVANEQAMRLMITTNGISFSQSAIDILQNIRGKMRNSVIITVSVDGGNRDAHEALRGNDTFDRTWITIERLVDAEIPVHVNCTITRRSQETVTNLLTKALDIGVIQVNLLPFVRRGHGLGISNEWLDPVARYEWLESFYESLSPERQGLLYGSLPEIIRRKEQTLKECIGGYAGLFYVLPDGVVYSCPRLVHSDFLVGNISEQSLEKLFFTVKNRLFCDSILADDRDEIDCRCKGSVLEERLAGNSKITLDEDAVRDRVLQNIASLDGVPMSACFSRNI